ncbi:hypothetical protein [Nocardia sp. NPDC003345]
MNLPDPAPAIAYIVTDPTDFRSRRSELRLRDRANRLGYRFCGTVLVPVDEPARLAILEDSIERYAAEAVFVPTVGHLEGRLERIVRRADVIDLNGGCYARWPSMTELIGHSNRPKSRCGRCGR